MSCLYASGDISWQTDLSSDASALRRQETDRAKHYLFIRLIKEYPTYEIISSDSIITFPKDWGQPRECRQQNEQMNIAGLAY